MPGWSDEVGSGAEEGGRRARIEAPSRGEVEGEMDTVCLLLLRLTMRKILDRAGDESWFTTCVPTKPTPMMATEQCGTANHPLISTSLSPVSALSLSHALEEDWGRQRREVEEQSQATSRKLLLTGGRTKSHNLRRLPLSLPLSRSHLLCRCLGITSESKRTTARARSTRAQAKRSVAPAPFHAPRPVELTPTPHSHSQATASTKCQKCMKLGHFTFECKNQREYKVRPTRTQILKNPKLRPELTASLPPRTEEMPKYAPLLACPSQPPLTTFFRAGKGPQPPSSRPTKPSAPQSSPRPRRTDVAHPRVTPRPGAPARPLRARPRPAATRDRVFTRARRVGANEGTAGGEAGGVAAGVDQRRTETTPRREGSRGPRPTSWSVGRGKAGRSRGTSGDVTGSGPCMVTEKIPCNLSSLGSRGLGASTDSSVGTPPCCRRPRCAVGPASRHGETFSLTLPSQSPVGNTACTIPPTQELCPKGSDFRSASFDDPPRHGGADSFHAQGFWPHSDHTNGFTFFTPVSSPVSNEPRLTVLLAPAILANSNGRNDDPGAKGELISRRIGKM